MAVAFGAGAGAAAASGVASQSVNIVTTGMRSVVVFAVTYGAANIYTGFTVGGTAMAAVAGGEAVDAAGEFGVVKAYFLDNVPIGASVAVVGSRTNNATVTIFRAMTFSAAGATEVHLPGIVLLQGDGAYTEQNTDDGTPGTNSVRAAGSFYGGASPAPVGANTTASSLNDQTSFGASWGFETTAGQGSRPVGFVQATADDRAAVHLAVREVPAGGGTLTPAFQTHTRAQFTIKTNPKLPVSFQTHTRAQFSVGVTAVTTVSAALQTHTRQQFALITSPKLPLSFQTHTRQQFALKTNPSLPLSFQSHTRQQFNVAISAGASLPLAFQTHTRQQFALTSSPTLPLGFQSHTRAQYTVMVAGQSLLGPTELIHTRAQFSLRINPTLVPARINHTRQQFNLFVPNGAAPLQPIPYHPTEPTEAELL